MENLFFLATLRGVYTYQRESTNWREIAHGLQNLRVTGILAPLASLLRYVKYIYTTASMQQ